ncbi:hypothetical protein [Halobacterium sp. KA-6]|uniref:hypothetical protein n=1 Tax=Halobacterium sp. KA-6 TaxID=2896368 RepID=UPI001E59FB70|nr:hypothetical protein [Halobacterium sp. KA-6]MCD2202759.1 hypothetical protein [Halobacterium sp. KA-6]
MSDADESAEYGRRSRRAIAREHVLGATVWAFGGGGARVRPWTRRDQLPKLKRAV